MKTFLFTAYLLLYLLVSSPDRSLGDCNGLKLDFIAVGEGDAIVLETPNREVSIIDTGNPATVFKVVRFLQERNIKTISKLILSHPHLDHIGGVFTLLNLFDVKSIFDNGEALGGAPSDPDFFRWYGEFVRSRSSYTSLKSNDVLRQDDMSLRVLSPPDVHYSTDWNTNSLVLHIRYGEFRALLMGDANHRTERYLLEMNEPLRSTLLKAGHHGASDTALPEFINRVSPSAVVISVNKDNIRGYPDKKTLRRFTHAGADIFRTDVLGSISFCALLSGKLRLQ